MSIFEPSRSPWTGRMLSVLRIVAGAVFISFGTMKLFGLPPMPAGMPPIILMSKLGLAGTLETFGGILILIGLLTRPVSFVLAGEMAVAYWMAHAPKAIYPALNGGDAAILFCFIFLYLVAAGPGAFSVDAARQRSA